MKIDKKVHLIQSITWGTIVFILCSIGITWWQITILILLILILSAISQIKGVGKGMVRLVTNKNQYNDLYNTLFGNDRHKD